MSEEENRKPPIVRLRVNSSPTDSILHAFVARDTILLADVSVHPSEEVCAIAQDLLSQEPTNGWDALSVRRSKIKGLRFHVYELMQGNVPQVWIFACVYDSRHVKKRQAQHFLQTIVSLTEARRYCDEAWRQGEYRACRDTVAPILLEHMHQVNCNGKAVENGNLDYCKRVIQANRKVLREINKRKKEADKTLLRGTSELNDEDTTMAFSVKEVYLDATTSTGSLSDECESITIDSVQSTLAVSESTSTKPKHSSSLGSQGAAVRLIQRRWRGCMVRHEYSTFMKSIVWIQRAFRGHKFRKKALLQYQSALCLQRHFLNPSRHLGGILHLQLPPDEENNEDPPTLGNEAQEGDDDVHCQVPPNEEVLMLSHHGAENDDDGADDQKLLKGPPSPLSVLELLDLERISRSQERNPKQGPIENRKKPKPLIRYQKDSRSGISLSPGQNGDDHWEERVVSSILTKMQLASQQNHERLEALKKSHAHALKEYHHDESFQELLLERDRQVAHVVEQLAESDAEIAELKGILNQMQIENAALKEQLAKQDSGNKRGRRNKNRGLSSS